MTHRINELRRRLKQGQRPAKASQDYDDNIWRSSRGWSRTDDTRERTERRPLGIRGRLTLTARLTDYSAPGSIGPAKRLKVILSSERLLGPTSVFLAPSLSLLLAPFDALSSSVYLRALCRPLCVYTLCVSLRCVPVRRFFVRHVSTRGPFFVVLVTHGGCVGSRSQQQQQHQQQQAAAGTLGYYSGSDAGRMGVLVSKRRLNEDTNGSGRAFGRRGGSNYNTNAHTWKAQAHTERHLAGVRHSHPTHRDVGNTAAHACATPRNADNQNEDGGDTVGLRATSVEAFG